MTSIGPLLQSIRQQVSQLLDGLIAFLRDNLTLVGGWVVVLAATALLGPYVSHWLRRSDERRNAHLEELKREVLRPMLDYLEEVLLPVASHHCGNVGICYEHPPRPTAGLIEVPVGYAERFCFRLATEAPVTTHTVPDRHKPPEPPGGEIVDDARHRHFRRLFRKWDEIVRKFERHNDGCIGYAEQLRSKIAEAVPLPLYAPDLQGPRWLKAIDLALVVLYRQIGLDTRQFARAPDGDLQSLVFTGTYWLAKGTPEEIARCVTEVDRLIAERDDVERLTARAESLRQEAVGVEREIERHLHLRRLLGRCRYL